MPVFLTPLWFAGLAALAVPIVIHLISRGRARVVRVGSVRWIVGANARRASRLRPTELWLLAIRALILALVAAALAGPSAPWLRSADRGPLVLVAAELLERRDELEPENAELYRRLDRTLAEAGEQQELTDAPGGVWSQIREVAAKLPAETRIEVFAPGRLTDLAGARPVLPNEVVWHAPRDGGSETWVEAQRTAPGGEVEQLVGVSSARRTTFEIVTGAVGAPVAAPEERSALVLYTAERLPDSRFVVAALRAAGPELPGTLTVAAVEFVADPPATPRPDLVVLLSPRPPPAPVFAWVEAGTTLLVDGGERWESCRGRPTIPGEVDATALWLERCSESGLRGLGPGLDAGSGTNPNDSGEAVALWWRGDGGSLLEGRRWGAGTAYAFHGRFNVEGSNLVLDPLFPRWLTGLAASTFEAAATADGRDLRAAQPSQLQPRRIEGESPVVPRGGRLPELALWGLAALLLVGERHWAGASS